MSILNAVVNDRYRLALARKLLRASFSDIKKSHLMPALF